MVWLVETVRAITDATLCLDHPNFEVIQKAAAAAGGNFIINSTTAKEEDLNRFLPLAARTGAGLIALTLDEKGVPNTTDGRVEIAARRAAFLPTVSSSIRSPCRSTSPRTSRGKCWRRSPSSSSSPLLRPGW